MAKQVFAPTKSFDAKRLTGFSTIGLKSVLCTVNPFASYQMIRVAGTVVLKQNDRLSLAAKQIFHVRSTFANVERMSFRVDTELFRGPVDLLLFLVRRHELELSEISLAKITDQYYEYLEVLQEIDVDLVGDFIDVASYLVELKSRHALPRIEEESDEPMADPRDDLVQRLLLYKKFKDAALQLEERSLLWQNRYQRMADDLPPRRVDFSDQPIKDVELWDLVSAFGRVLRDNLPKPEANIIYDETPIQVYMQQIHARLVEEGHVSFTSLFSPGMHKSAMVGIFLAVLELARHHNVETRQGALHSEIDIVPSEGFNRVATIADVDDYDHGKTRPGDPASLVE